MHIHVVPNRGSPPTVLLRESYREGTKVGKRTLANLSSLSAAQIEAIRAALRGEACAAGQRRRFEVTASRAHGHVQAVALAMQRLGFASLLAAKPSRERELVLAMVAARIVAPHTKLATTRWWHTTTLAEDFGVADAERGRSVRGDGLAARAPGRDPEEARRAPPERGRPGAVRPVVQLLRGHAPARWPSWATTATARRACCRSTTACSPMRAAARWRCRCTRATWPTARPCCPRCSGCARTSASSSW